MKKAKIEISRLPKEKTIDGNEINCWRTEKGFGGCT